MTLIIWRKFLLSLFGISVGAACFWLASRNVDLSDAKRIFEASEKRWIAVGIGLFGADLLVRIIRWRAILSHHKQISYAKIARGMLCGYAVNIFLPARLGELFRADYTARISRINRATLFSSIFVERLTDLVAVILILILGLLLSDVRDQTIDRAAFFSAFILLVGIALIYLTLLQTARRRWRYLLTTLASKLLSDTVATRLVGSIRNFANLLEIVPTRKFVLVLVLTVPIWSLELLSVFSICRSVGLTLTPASLMLLLGAASLSTLLPTAPGFVGSYQFAYVVVLRNFGVSGALAIVAATGVQIYLMLLYAAIGLTVLAFSPPIELSGQPID